MLPTLPARFSGIELQVRIVRCLESSGGAPPSTAEKDNPYVRKKLLCFSGVDEVLVTGAN